MATSGAIGAFIGSFMTHIVPSMILLSIITLIISYEAIDLLKRSGKFKQRKNNTATKSPVIDNLNEDKQSKDIDASATNSNNTFNNTIAHYNEKDQSRSKILKEILIGFGVGFLGGMVGLVLGSVRMPAMITVLKLPVRIAVGTNLASSAVMGTVGIIGHLINNNIDYVVIMIMGPSAMFGAFMGAKFTNKIEEQNLKLIISIILFLVAATMLWRILQLSNIL